MMQKEPEDWTQEEVARFFEKVQTHGASTEDIQTMRRLLQKRVNEGKELLRKRARKMN